MKEIKKTFQELRDIDNLMGELYRKKPELPQTKFGYAFKRFSEKNFIPVLKELQDAIAIVRIEHALENKETKEILVDPNSQRGYKYSKDGLIALIKAENKLIEKYQSKEINCEPYISSYVPDGLTEEQKAILTGLIL